MKWRSSKRPNLWFLWQLWRFAWSEERSDGFSDCHGYWERLVWGLWWRPWLPSRLHVYCNSVVFWFVARSPKHAARLYRKYERNAGWGDDESDLDLDFNLVPDHAFISVRDDESDTTRRQTAREWANQNGIGFLCTTEY